MRVHRSKWVRKYAWLYVLSGCGGSAEAVVDDATVRATPDAGSVALAIDASLRGDAASSGDASPRADAASARGELALYDDFEGDAPDAAVWRVLTSYSGQPSTQNQVSIDHQHVLRGQRALHVHTETSDPVYLETVTLPTQKNGFYGRVFAYFGADPGARSKGHWGAFVGVGKKNGQDVEVRIGGQFDILVDNYSPNDALQISSSRDGFYDDGTRLPVATWTCFEFQFDGAGEQLHVWMNEQEITRLHVTDWNQFGHGLTPDWSPAYDRLRIGYQSWNADTPIDVWYDAVAIDPQRIGCTR